MKHVIALAQATNPLAWLVLSGVFFAAGEYLSKKFAGNPGWGYVALICLFYMGGSLAWLPAILKTNQLAVTGMIWYAICMTITIALGLIVFAEKFTLLTGLGMALAFVAVLILSLA